MDNYQRESEFENQRLTQTVSFIESQLDQAKIDNENNREAIIEAKREMRENSAHSISGLWTSDGFEDLVELSQYMNSITQKISNFERIENRIAMLKRLAGSPYFARIDFKFSGEDEFEKVYIGRSFLMDDGTGEIHVYDWRSPIAGMFYRFTTGLAFYEAPAGRMEGEINLKRQHEIKNGKLEYFFDADVQVVDEFLRKLLSQNASTQMKAIVETIQKEQDVVIRDMENDLIMVQGAAGSGKTSIALHRAAYLMYQGLSAQLSANNIMIISPNAIFEQYIANVLPELGEENIASVIFDEILTKIIKKKRIQTKNQYLETLISDVRFKKVMESSLKFKCSRQFTVMMNRYIDNLQGKNIGADAFELYGRIIRDENVFNYLARGLTLPENIRDIVEFSRENLSSKTLFYDDAVAVAYLKLKQNGTSEFQSIRQVVIDEAQDYYPLHYEVFNLLFSNAKYTVLGDVSQTLEKHEDMGLYEQIGSILNKKKAALVTMDKSFRCTSEILAFSSKFISHDIKIKSFNRKGREPEIYTAKDRESLCDMIASEVNACRMEGYRSIGLICKTEKNAFSLSKSLKDIKAVPVYMSKGLEFDAVLICDADKINYNSEEDKRLLYIACTRALHRLSLFCEGEASPLL